MRLIAFIDTEDIWLDGSVPEIHPVCVDLMDALHNLGLTQFLTVTCSTSSASIEIKES